MNKKFIKNLIVFLLVGMYSTTSLSVSVAFTNSNEMLLLVKSLLPKNPIILEAGGHYGEDTIRMKSVWPDAIMHVFEPLPTSFAKLFKGTRHLSGIVCYSYALASYSGKARFYLDRGNDGASSINSPVQWNQHEFDKKPIEVSCITINDWAKLNNIPRVDFMWLDMEGHELYALQQASSILASVQAIYTEVDFVPIRVNACLYQDVKKFLESQGFYEIGKTITSKIQGNALFIRKKVT